MKAELIVLASSRMDSNKRRDENSLLRMSKATRDSMDSKAEMLTVRGAGERKKALEVFRAFSEDLKAVKAKFPKEDWNRIAFTTTKTFNLLAQNKAKRANVWISDDIESTVMGADPEFLIFNENGDVVKANNGWTGLSYHGDLGYDGPMAEIRPHPEENPAKLVENILNIFKKHSRLLTQYTCQAACYHKDAVRDYPVGGHLHIGNPVQILNIPSKERKALIMVLNKVLDELLAVPLIKLDGEIGSVRRTGCQMAPIGLQKGYGYFGEYRCPNSGSRNARLENRTLSGMWLLHPTVAKAVIGTAKIIVEEAFRLVYDHNNSPEYFGYPLLLRDPVRPWKRGFSWKKVQLCQDIQCTRPSGYLIRMLNNSDPKIITQAFLKSWKERITKFVSCKDDSFIETLYEILSIPTEELQNWPRDLRVNWLEGKKFIVN